MKRFLLKILIPALLAATVLFACVPEDTPDSPATPPSSDMTQTLPGMATQPTAASSGDGRFTLRYNSDFSLNPIEGESADNLLIAALLYEGLFRVEPDFTVTPVLCESYETTDGKTYTFNIKPDIQMSDGSTLTAQDVHYTMNRSNDSERYSARFKNVEDISSDGLKLTVTLAAADFTFPALLDIPVIKFGSLSSNVPPGTGPYILIEGEEPYLKASALYRDKQAQPVEEIYLTECSDKELIELFATGAIDLFRGDPLDPRWENMRADYELHTYSTTTLQFLGMNGRTAAMRDPLIRKAISLCVDRDYIAGTVLGGYAAPTDLIIPSASSLYYDALADIIDGTETAAALFAEVGLEDANSDAYLEYPTESGFVPISLTLLVNSESERKLEAAESIAAALEKNGIKVTVQALEYEKFIEALEEGSFDIYYGEVTLGANFDFAPLLRQGGALDYGNLQSEEYSALSSSRLAARAGTETDLAVRNLCKTIYNNAPVIPVAYMKNAVFTGRGVISGLSPTVSGVLTNLDEVEINLG